MASREQGATGGQGNRERDDRGKRPMVDPDPIREPVEETFEEGELASIIMGQPKSPSTREQGGLEISDLTRKIGQGSYGSVYLVGFRDVALGLELGMEGVVPYVAKKCNEKPPYSAWVMMHKELASFAETHCAIVRPIACHNIEVGAHHKRN
ncbi:hypothetical protein R1sor_002493 [Riccia sorocarpa]|uniref:Protein kinase domain-containing protein n=1 Tax=Riccia sorocarpa TaxID=122646 RepID=A0ABD3H0M3_9MARC